MRQITVFPEKRLEQFVAEPYTVNLMCSLHTNYSVPYFKVERWRFYCRVTAVRYASVEEARAAFEEEKQAAITDLACEAMGVNRTDHARGGA